MEKFNVVQFLASGFHEYVARNVAPDEAVKKVQKCLNTAGAKNGVINRIIITDSMDFTNFEWGFGEGIVFPRREDL